MRELTELSDIYRRTRLLKTVLNMLHYYTKIVIPEEQAMKVALKQY